MSIAITANDTTPVSVVQAINISVSGAASNTATGYDDDNYPASPAVGYYISVEKSGQDSLVSQVFNVDSTGAFSWASVIIPTSGTWTAHLRKTADDSSAANVSIVAS